MRSAFVIEGLAGKQVLSGTIPVRGAKNGALKAFAASLLFDDALRLSNVPDIADIAHMAELLRSIGVSVDEKGKGVYVLDPKNAENTKLNPEHAKKMRASVSLIGPLLARFGEVSFPHPGGCVLGARPIDLFVDGFRKMGAVVSEENQAYVMRAPNGLRGADIFFPVQSVGATETIMHAAIRARGTTVLRNSAMEPEVADLAEFLNECGARIERAGTPTVVIHGTDALRANGKTYTNIPDRIETGSFLALAALAGDEVVVAGCNPEHVRLAIELLQKSGVSIETTENTITVSGAKSRKPLKPFSFRTHEYPGFATDIQAPFTVFLTQAQGESVVFETIFEDRLQYTQDLTRMGADITQWNRREIMIKGPTPLRARTLEAPDIRAGLAFVIAAVIAEGTSTIFNPELIDRGYEDIEERLSAIGVSIRRKAVNGSGVV